MGIDLKTIYHLVSRKELTPAGAKELLGGLLSPSGAKLQTASNPAPGEEGPVATSLGQPVSDQAIAVIGMAGRFPGAADVGSFWENLVRGRSTITEVPANRWDVNAYYDPDPKAPGKTQCKWGGFLDDIDRFDPLFFNISGKEAQVIDPQHRLFLQEAWKAIEDAGYSEGSLSGARCGVFVGTGSGDYTYTMIERGFRADPYAFMGNAASVLAARISYMLNLKGPSVAVDTACSSSLVALHLATRSILSGDCDLALAGGVFVSTCSSFHYLTGRSGMLSPQGRCKAFDDSADGFVPGEGVGVVVLKSLSGAIEDKDHIYGVVRASGLNQDGRTNGITAPSAVSQADLEIEVYRRAGLSPETISYIEAHGTGTKLGDPIEIQALTKAFSAFTDKKQFCAIGSVKTNIGHASTAAGIASVIKVLLALKAKQIPPSLNFERPNRHIRFSDTPFYVNTKLIPWEAREGTPRRAAVSSFGLSGTNAHVILEEPPADPRPRRSIPWPLHLAAVSAKTDEALEERLADLEQWLSVNGGSHQVSDVAFTLGAGRCHFDRRVAFVIRDLTDLADQIRARREQRSAKEPHVGGAHGRSPRDPVIEEKGRVLIRELKGAIDSGNSDPGFFRPRLTELASLYENHYNPDWGALYGRGEFPRLSLPTYPFAKEAYWLPDPVSSPTPQTVPWRPAAATGGLEETVGVTLRQTQTGDWSPESGGPEEEPHLFGPVWRVAPLDLSRTGPQPGVVLVLDRTLERFLEIRRLCVERWGQATKVALVRPATSFSQPDSDTFELDPNRDEDFERLWSVATSGNATVHVLHFWNIDSRANEWLSGAGRFTDEHARHLDEQLNSGVRSILSLVRAASLAGSRARFLYLYEATPDQPQPQNAAVSGMVGSLGVLGSGLELSTVELSGVAPADVPKIAIDELAAAGQRALVETRYHAHRRWDREFVLIKGLPQQTSGVVHQGDVVLITGGCGAIGLALGRHLAQAFGARLVLTGRSELDAMRMEKIDALRASGIEVEYVRADCCDQAAMEHAVAFALNRFGRLDGVIHAAGMLGDQILTGKDRAAIDRVLAPKIQGTVILDAVTRDKGLSFFVLCSSVSTALGDFGQCDYAIANRFMDGFAELREKARARSDGRGLTLSIGWPLWQSGGIRFPDGGEELYRTTSGLRLLSTEGGVRAFERALAHGAPRVLVLDGDLEKIGNLPRFHCPLPPKPTIPATLDVGKGEEDARSTLAEITSVVSELLKVPVQRLDPNTNFGEFGVDSIMLKELADAIGRRFGIELNPSTFFAHATLAKLNQYLQSEHGPAIRACREAAHRRQDRGVAGRKADSHPRTGEETSRPTTGGRRAEGSSPQPTGEAEPVAIVGASGVFPQSHDLAEFWRNLKSERDMISEVPPDRWDWRRFYGGADSDTGRSNSKWGGFMPDVDKFDAAFFNISPREAAFMDPQHRIFLETTWRTIEDAGYRPSSLAGKQVGLFVGAQFNEYMGLMGKLANLGEAQAQAALGNTLTMLANRVSYLLDFHGPSETIDTACSSALIAVHHAVRAIRNGECELAVAGGVSAILSPDTFTLTSQLGMLSPDGRCKTFDHRANGYVKGEGVGAVLLKPLGQAILDNDHIYAVVRGTAANHGGKANSLTAPNPLAQADLLITAYSRAGIDPATVGYIEAHGTGTELGDPVEVDGLKRAFSTLVKGAREKAWCGLGSVKTNIGHLEPAAGIAGLIKVLLAIHYRTIPATLHVEQVNPYIDLDKSPFYLVTRTREFATLSDEQGRPLPRRAGVSSFGFGGSNAHVILEEYVAPEDAGSLTVRDIPSPQLVVLSARNEERLREAEENLLRFLRDSTTKVSLVDLAYTLQCGREPMEARLAIVASSFEELCSRIEQHLQGRCVAEGVFIGRARTGTSRLAFFENCDELDTFIRSLVASGKLSRIAALWVEGCELNWTALFTEAQPRRISLPTYPFARTRHWFDAHGTPADRTEPLEVPPEPCETKPQLPAEPIHEVIRSVTPPRQTASELAKQLKTILASALYMEESDIGDATSFAELGMDSILAVEFVKQINDRLGTNLKATRLYDYSCIRDLAEHLSTLDSALSEPPLEPSVTPQTRSDSPSPKPPTETSGKGTPRPPAITSEIGTPQPLADRLRSIVASVLSVDTADLDGKSTFTELGLDLVTATEVVQTINEEFGVELNAIRLYELQDLANLEGHLSHLLKSGRVCTVPPLSDPQDSGRYEPSTPARLPDETITTGASQAPSARTEDIAIIGLSGRFPGARDVRQFWVNLASGIDSVADVPRDRFDIDAYYSKDPGAPNKTYCRRGGFLADIDQFDPLFFNVSPWEAEMMDPQQRLFLEEAWKAFEDAAYGEQSLSGSRCGVFVGVAGGDYTESLRSSGAPASGSLMLGNACSILTARISHLLNLKGPSIPVETACSSALVALHLACQSIRSGECDMALAGGVCVMSTPQPYIMTSQARMLSPEGRCKTFDDSADGFVPAEGVGMVVVKSLARAISDRDHIYAVIKGSGINQDGKTSTITAPSSFSQTALEVEVYERFGINPDTINAVEAHGTGTKLGDPIEIEAITAAFRRFTARTQFCAIGSVKSNIGHSLAASGAAGLIKMVLALQHREIPPSIHFTTANHHIDFTESPFFVNTTLRPWPRPSGAPRRAAISSFGFSGTNAHVVIEEPPCARSPSDPRPARILHRPYHLVPISAKTQEALVARVQALMDWLSSEGRKADLADISFTLSAGRSHYARCRAAIVTNSHDDLSEKLRCLRDQPTAASPLPSGVFLASIRSGLRSDELSQTIDRLIHEIHDTLSPDVETYGQRLSSLAEGYVSGCDVDWNSFFSGQEVHRLSMPTYPFARRRCWVEVSKAEDLAANTGTLHPLLDAAVPSLEGACFVRRFVDREPIVKDHVVLGHAILPGVAYLEMARAAGSLIKGHGPVQQIRATRLVAPYAPDTNGREVFVRLQAEGDLVRFRIESETKGMPVLHATGLLEYGDRAPSVESLRLDLEAIRARCPDRAEARELYPVFRAAGIAHGVFFRAIDHLVANQDEVLSRITLGPTMESSLGSYVLHPALMDAALQSTIGLFHGSADGNTRPMVPSSIELMDLVAPLKKVCWVHAQRTGGSAEERFHRFHVDVVDESGALLVTMDDLVVREPQAFPTPRPKSPLPEEASSPTRPEGELSFLKPTWRRSQFPAPVSRESDPDAHVLIVRPSDDLGISRRLSEEIGPDRVHEIVLGETTDQAEFERVLAELPTRLDVYFLACGQATDNIALDRLAEDQERGVLSLLRLVKAMRSRRGRKDPNRNADRYALKIVTTDVQRILESDSICPTNALVVGLGRTIQTELNDLEVVSLDLASRDLMSYDSERSRLLALRILAESPSAVGLQVAYRQDERFEGVLERIELKRPDPTRLPLKEQGVYLIVGGGGGIGLEIAEYFASLVKPRLVLVGRGELNRGKLERLDRIRSLGAEVVYERADVCDRSAMDQVVARARQRWGKINGAIHSAVVLRDRTIDRMDEATFREALAPKVTGSVVLEEVLRPDALDFLVFFSTSNSFTAGAGQSNYVAASWFEDVFGMYLRHQQHRPVQVINWGYWGTIGVVSGKQYEERAARLGVRPIQPAEGLDAFTRVLASGLAQVAPVKVDRSVLEELVANPTAWSEREVADRRSASSEVGQLATGSQVPPGKDSLCEGVSGVPVRGVGGPRERSDRSSRAALGSRTEVGGPRERSDRSSRAALGSRGGVGAQPQLQYLIGVLSETLRVSRAEVDSRARFDEYGVDSLVSIEVLRRLEKDLGPLSPTLLIEQPTVEKLATYLGDQHGPALAKLLSTKAHETPQAATSGRLVPIRPSGSRPPIFLVHGAMGDVNWGVKLAHHLGPEWPVYGLRSRGLDGLEEPLNSLEEMAAEYVEAVKPIEPHGPYILGGYSMGGVIAFEMARQLSALSKPVSHLLLFDTYAPGSRVLTALRSGPGPDDRVTWVTVGNMLNIQWGGAPTLTPDDVVGLDADGRAMCVAQHLARQGKLPHPVEELAQILATMKRVFDANARAMEHYGIVRHTSPTRVIMFRCDQGLAGRESSLSTAEGAGGNGEEDHGWSELLSPVEIFHEPCNHFGLMTEPVVLDVARRLVTVLTDDRKTDDQRVGKDEIFRIVKDVVLKVVPELSSEQITASASLKRLGVNSIDRVEVASLSMEEFGARIPPSQLAEVTNLAGLVELLHQHMGEGARP